MTFVSRCTCLTKEFAKLSLKAGYSTSPFNSSRPFDPNPREPKKKYPYWLQRKQRVLHDDFITLENRRFIERVVQGEMRGVAEAQAAVTFETSPLKESIPNHGVWTPETVRCGLIAKKLGDYPVWTKEGARLNTTLLHVVENNVIKYEPPPERSALLYNRRAKLIRRPLGHVLVGAVDVDPSFVTKEYYGLFKKWGVTPKKHLCRFFVTPEAALPPGQPLSAMHFRVGDYVDVRGTTIYHGFQGVMKRWGFHGQPATHGACKTHRRPGNIGGGGEKGRVWPGTKLPGHMGRRWRTLRGARILRIDPEHNVIWVHGLSVPGETNSLCYIYDSILPRRKPETPPPFPTHVATSEDREGFHDILHRFDAPTITYPE